MYIDKKDGTEKKIGWVFQKKNHYTNSDEKYMQETWIELHKSAPLKSITYNLLEM
jgi:hypothetical protein